MWISDQCFLSPRDRVIVAWQFTARNDAGEDPSRRVGCDGYYRWPGIWRMCLRLRGKSLFNIANSNRSYRSLRDESFSYNIPGSKLPGYYHSVPTGQKPPDTWGTKSTSHHRSSSTMTINGLQSSRPRHNR